MTIRQLITQQSEVDGDDDENVVKWPRRLKVGVRLHQDQSYIARDRGLPEDDKEPKTTQG